MSGRWVEVTGEVLEADVKVRRFQLWRDARTRIAVSFTEAQEDTVTEALRHHRCAKLRVRGRGVRSARGQLAAIRDVTELTVVRADEDTGAAPARPVEEIIAEITGGIPAAELAQLPADLGENHDHYLYGAPRR